MRISAILVAAWLCLSWFAVIGGGSVVCADESLDFFESRIRPVLVEHCYSCHNSSGKAEGSLKLDFRDGLRSGGDSGPSVVPGKPDESLLLQAIRHTPELKMPRGGPKLSAAVARDFEQWIRRGAADPRDKPPSADELAKATSWEAQLAARKQWWSFQPIRRAEPPQVKAPDWNKQPIDRFIRAKLDEAQLEPLPPADPRVLIRRASYALTGLPPTPEVVEEFVAHFSSSHHPIISSSKQDEGMRRLWDDGSAYAVLIDRLLASPRFGERWARHWMDWVRYADSHGSEGDPVIPHAWRYRDYLIRALNADVPYDQLVREHLAGDLLPQPRINHELGINESALGTGHLRMVFHGYAPVDPLDEQVRFIENEIDVISKTFLGLTVACARCHDHKFDAISQKDFYALYGILNSCRPALITVDTPQRQQDGREALGRLKPALKARLAERWQDDAGSIAERMLEDRLDLTDGVKQAVLKDSRDPLHAWFKLASLEGPAFKMGWDTLLQQAAELRQKQGDFERTRHARHWRMTEDDLAAWYAHGTGTHTRPVEPGDFDILSEGDRIVGNIYPGGVYSHLFSTKHNGMLTSPRFAIEADELWVRVAGGGGSRVRYVMENYPRVGSPIYKGVSPTDTPRWVKWDLRFFEGDACHVEIATAADLPTDATDADRSWFGICEAVMRKAGDPEPVDLGASLAMLCPDANPITPQEMAKLYANVLSDAVEAWRDGDIDDRRAEFLGVFVRRGLLTNSLAAWPEGKPLVESYRQQERAIIVPMRAPGVLEGDPIAQCLMVRGNHKQLSAPVPHRFLDALGARNYPNGNSGRLELAADLVDPRNPLTARVIANRVWHYLMGRGIVATPDNFGRLGELPTHPELLDHLAASLVDNGWSLKKLIRSIMLSRTYQTASSAEANPAHNSQLATHNSIDPANKLWWHVPVRRLEAEAIRDSLLFVAGALDETRYGPSVGSSTPRRSVYVEVRRNRLDPFLTAFDAPEPFTTRGSRDATNVPAQSLTLLNDPFVRSAAVRIADLVVIAGAKSTKSADVIDSLYRRVLGRLPDASERESCRQFVETLAVSHRDTELRWKEKLVLAEAMRRELNALLEPVRKRLSTTHSSSSEVRSPSAAATPQPLACWEFEGNLRDSVGEMHARAVGNARVEDGALVLDGSSYAATDWLAHDLREKTLEAWVQLDRLEQRGGGVMNVERRRGDVFDAMVFGEQAPQHWLAGSDHFRRTRPLEGIKEIEAVDRPVHFALTYATDGTISAYRDGRPYGHSYHAADLVTFKAGQSQVLFGLRHSPSGGNKHLRGRIYRAALYDRALSANEIAASSASIAPAISRAKLLESVDAATRQRYERIAKELREAEDAAREFEQLTARGDPKQVWEDLALTLFNLKEFLYVR